MIRRLDDGERSGVNRVVWWLLGVTTAISISLLGAWGRSLQQQTNKNADAISQLQAIVYSLPAMDTRMTRIENKVDLLLEKK